MNKKSILTKALCAFAISIAPTFSWATNFEGGTSIGTYLIRNNVDSSQLMKMSDVFNNYEELLDGDGKKLAGTNPYIIIPKFVAGYKYNFVFGGGKGGIPQKLRAPEGYVDAIYDYVFQINPKKYLHILTTIVQSVDQTLQNVTDSSSYPSFTIGYNSGIIGGREESFSTPYTGKDANNPNVPFKYPDALQGYMWLYRNYKMKINLPSFLGVYHDPAPEQQFPNSTLSNGYYGIQTNEFCASIKLPDPISSGGYYIFNEDNQNKFKPELATYPAAYNVYCYPNTSSNPTYQTSVFSTTLYLLVTNTKTTDSKGKLVYYNLNQDRGQDEKVRKTLDEYNKGLVEGATSLFCLDIMNANLDLSIFKIGFVPIDPTTFTSIDVPQR